MKTDFRIAHEGNSCDQYLEKMGSWQCARTWNEGEIIETPETNLALLISQGNRHGFFPSVSFVSCLGNISGAQARLYATIAELVADWMR